MTDPGNVIRAVEVVTLGAGHDARATSGSNETTLLLEKDRHVGALVLVMGFNERLIELRDLLLLGTLPKEGLGGSEEKRTR